MRSYKHSDFGRSSICFGDAPLPSTAPPKTVSANLYADNQNQNSGNMLTGRSTTRVMQPPGGASSICLGIDLPSGPGSQTRPTTGGYRDNMPDARACVSAQAQRPSTSGYYNDTSDDRAPVSDQARRPSTGGYARPGRPGPTGNNCGEALDDMGSAGCGKFADARALVAKAEARSRVTPETPFYAEEAGRTPFPHPHDGGRGGHPTTEAAGRTPFPHADDHAGNDIHSDLFGRPTPPVHSGIGTEPLDQEARISSSRTAGQTRSRSHLAENDASFSNRRVPENAAAKPPIPSNRHCPAKLDERHKELCAAGRRRRAGPDPGASQIVFG